MVCGLCSSNLQKATNLTSKTNYRSKIQKKRENLRFQKAIPKHLLYGNNLPVPISRCHTHLLRLFVTVTQSTMSGFNHHNLFKEFSIKMFSLSRVHPHVILKVTPFPTHKNSERQWLQNGNS